MAAESIWLRWTSKHGCLKIQSFRHKLNSSRTIADLTAALRVAGSHGAGGALLLFPSRNPPLSDSDSDDRSIAIDIAKTALLAECDSIPGWSVLDVTDAVILYSIARVRDPFTEELGDIPFTEEMYAATATTAARWIRAACSKPRKVIVLDCDNTLWQGVYAEGSMLVTPPYRQLQEFMLRKMENGTLLALSSKNNEEDVMSALQSDGCLLRPEHFAAWQINWASKSENLKILANDLGLALDSFIFVDDSSLECLEVRNGCPEVLTVQLPAQPESIPEFLDHLWVFDRPVATAEDGARTSMYQAERQRTELSKRALTVEEFLSSLQIEIQFASVAEAELPRVAQLTQRTTQFNLTGVQHTEQSLISTLAEGRNECWTVRVQDTFGDYGLVGVLLFETRHDALYVEVLLLSCRALGRGVEDQMIDKLKGWAIAHGVPRIVIPVVPTARSRPALEFLHRLYNVPIEAKNPFECVLSVADNSSELRLSAATITDSSIKTEPVKKRHTVADERDTMLRIATELRSAASIISTVRSIKKARPADTGPFVAPSTAIEGALANLWFEYLGIQPIGTRDDYFELGGTSLIASTNTEPYIGRIWS